MQKTFVGKENIVAPGRVSSLNIIVATVRCDT